MIERLVWGLAGAFGLAGGVGRGGRGDHGETETRQLSPPGRGVARWDMEEAEVLGLS